MPAWAVKGGVGMDLQDVAEVKEVLNIREVNELLSKGWKLINVLQWEGRTEFFNTISAQPVYVVGRPSSDKK